MIKDPDMEHVVADLGNAMALISDLLNAARDVAVAEARSHLSQKISAEDVRESFLERQLRLIDELVAQGVDAIRIGKETSGQPWLVLSHVRGSLKVAIANIESLAKFREANVLAPKLRDLATVLRRALIDRPAPNKVAMTAVPVRANR